MEHRRPKHRASGLALFSRASNWARLTEDRAPSARKEGHSFAPDVDPHWIAFDASPTATVVMDDQLRILTANRAYARLTGHRIADLIGTAPAVRLIAGEDPHGVVLPAGCEFAMHCAVMLSRSDGGQRRAWMSWNDIKGVGGLGCLRVATFSEQGRWDGEFEHWRHRAQHDALTGLPNRDRLQAEFERGLARAARHGHGLAVLFIDLDGFKSVNDALGHAAGDRLLSRVGLRLRDTLRAEDFVARYGGDEFVVLLEAPRHAGDAAAAAGALLKAIGEDTKVQGAGLPAVTASIGIALYPDHASQPEALLQAADAAMYRAKRAGGNVFAFGSPESKLTEAEQVAG